MKSADLLASIRADEVRLRDRQADLRAKWVRFGRAVRAERKARGASLKAFSIDLGRTSQMVIMMELGSRAWPAGIAERAVQLLKRPEQWPDAGRLP